VYVCVCVCERERERESVCVCVRERERESVCVCVLVITAGRKAPNPNAVTPISYCWSQGAAM